MASSEGVGYLVSGILKVKRTKIWVILMGSLGASGGERSIQCTQHQKKKGFFYHYTEVVAGANIGNSPVTVLLLLLRIVDSIIQQ